MRAPGCTAFRLDASPLSCWCSRDSLTGNPTPLLFSAGSIDVSKHDPATKLPHVMFQELLGRIFSEAGIFTCVLKREALKKGKGGTASPFFWGLYFSSTNQRVPCQALLSCSLNLSEGQRLQTSQPSFSPFPTTGPFLLPTSPPPAGALGPRRRRIGVALPQAALRAFAVRVHGAQNHGLVLRAGAEHRLVKPKVSMSGGHGQAPLNLKPCKVTDPLFLFAQSIPQLGTLSSYQGLNLLGADDF